MHVAPDVESLTVFSSVAIGADKKKLKISNREVIDDRDHFSSCASSARAESF